jgi:tetratricopeptide (TPR) repeat protein
MYKKIPGLLCILFLLIACPYGHAAPEQIFEIQVGAYSDLINAEAMHERMERYDYSVFTREIHNQNGSKLIQVLVGPFSKIQEAQNAMNYLQSQGIHPFIRTGEHSVSEKLIASSSVTMSKTDSQESIHTQQAPVDSDRIVSVVKLIHESREQVAINDLDGALKFAREAVAIDPAYADAWKQLGRVLMLRGNYADAASSLQTVLMLNPDDRDAQIWILRSYLAKDQMREITNLIEKLQTVTTSELDNALITDLLARLFEQSDIKGVAKVAEFWMKKAPQPGARQAAAGIMRLAEGDGEAAEQTLANSDTSDRRVYPLFALAWQRLGIQYMVNNQPVKAVDAFQKSLEFKPNWIPALRELGWAYRRAGKPNEAADTWSRGLKVDSRLTGWLLWIAKAHTEAGQFSAATQAVDRLLKSEPSSNEARALKLSLLILQEKDKEARDYERQLRKVSKGDYLVALGNVYAERSTGKFREAADRLEEFLKKYPKNTEIRKTLAETYAEWAYRVPSQDAVYPLQKLVALEPSRTGAWRDLGWSLWANGKYEEAISAWERAVSSDISGREQVIIQVVAWLAEQGQDQKAIELYRRWQPHASLFSLGYELYTMNRFIASRVVLSAAWEAGENIQMTGLYLADTEARAGICAPVHEHISPFLEQNIHEAEALHIETLLRVLKSCSSEKSLLPTLLEIEESLGQDPQYAPLVTSILDKAAREQMNAHELESSFRLYTRVLKRDPNLPDAWSRAVDIAVQSGRQEEAIDILNTVLTNATSEVVLEGARGRLALLENDPESAIEHYGRSLSLNPDQPALRMDYFDVLIALEDFNEARRQTEWFEDQLAKGNDIYRSNLAKMMSELGEIEKSLELWQHLYLTYPETPAYAIETARYMFYLCRVEEAKSILQQLATIRHDPRAYELLAEIEVVLGNPDEAISLTEKGLAIQEKRGLLRIRAESASMLERHCIAREAAESVLRDDPGNIVATMIAGKAMLDQGMFQEAKEYYAELLKRNNSFLPSLLNLREISSWMGKPDEVSVFAQKVVELRPWNVHAQIRSANSYAEDGDFRPALDFLRAESEKDIKQAIPLLVYGNVSHCSYRGKTSSAQVIKHLERLFAEGYTFITPGELDLATDQPRAIIIIDRADVDALEEIDAALQRMGGRLILTTNTGALSDQMPNNPSPAKLKELESSGRWLIASSGPVSSQSVPINEKGTLGNPLTHRIYRNNEVESPALMTARLDTLLSDASRSLGSVRPRIFVYPKGDYGQLSLDTDSETIKIFHDTLEKYFDFAIAADDNGFVTFDYRAPLYLPARVVPAQWSSDDLMNHVVRKNPLVMARLELAKVLYLQSQHERANKWFHRAEELQANPRDVNFHWGNNAYIEGDLPTALEKLRKTQELDLKSERVNKALERAEERKRPFLNLDVETLRDSDKREYFAWGGNAHLHVSDRLSFEVFADDIEWSREEKGEEKGVRIGGGLLWYFSEEKWLNARLWHMGLDDIENYFGGSINLHLPNASWGGFIDLQAARETIDTVEAVREEILADRFTLRTYSRILDFWDLFANVTYMHRTDDNDTIMVDGVFQRRLKEWPFYGLGYKFRIANSDSNPSEIYWAPVDLQQHELYFTTRGEVHNLHYSISGNAGYAKEEDTGWRFVWGGRIELDYRLLSRIMLNGQYIHQETPIYQNNVFLFGLKFRF